MKNSFNLKQTLSAIPEAERPEYLKSSGYPAREIPDLLDFLFAPPVEKISLPRSKADQRWEETMAKAAALAIKLAENPPEPTVDGMPPFQRDTLHIQHLMGGSTLHDEASYHNPQVIQTRTMQWLRNEFMPGGVHFALLLGKPGCGKTFAALAYVNLVAKVRFDQIGKLQESNARYIDAYSLASMLRDDRKHKAELEAITRCGVLLLDDLGSEPTGWRGDDLKAHLGYLINERYRFKKKTIITTNASLEEFRILYGERVVSRFAEVGLFYQTSDPDLRRPIVTEEKE